MKAVPSIGTTPISWVLQAQVLRLEGHLCEWIFLKAVEAVDCVSTNRSNASDCIEVSLKENPLLLTGMSQAAINTRLWPDLVLYKCLWCRPCCEHHHTDSAFLHSISGLLPCGLTVSYHSLEHTDHSQRALHGKNRVTVVPWLSLPI